jgi:hypothetical protein
MGSGREPFASVARRVVSYGLAWAVFGAVLGLMFDVTLLPIAAPPTAAFGRLEDWFETLAVVVLGVGAAYLLGLIVVPTALLTRSLRGFAMAAVGGLAGGTFGYMVASLISPHGDRVQAGLLVLFWLAVGALWRRMRGSWRGGVWAGTVAVLAMLPVLAMLACTLPEEYPPLPVGDRWNWDLAADGVPIAPFLGGFWIDLGCGALIGAGIALAIYLLVAQRPAVGGLLGVGALGAFVGAAAACAEAYFIAVVIEHRVMAMGNPVEALTAVPVAGAAACFVVGAAIGGAVSIIAAAQKGEGLRATARWAAGFVLAFSAVWLAWSGTWLARADAGRELYARAYRIAEAAEEKGTHFLTHLDFGQLYRCPRPWVTRSEYPTVMRRMREFVDRYPASAWRWHALRQVVGQANEAWCYREAVKAGEELENQYPNGWPLGFELVYPYQALGMWEKAAAANDRLVKYGQQHKYDSLAWCRELLGEWNQALSAWTNELVYETRNAAAARAEKNYPESEERRAERARRMADLRTLIEDVVKARKSRLQRWGGSLSGRIVREGRGVPGVGVRLEYLSRLPRTEQSRDWLMPMPAVCTDSEGRFDFRGLRPGMYSISLLVDAVRHLSSVGGLVASEVARTISVNEESLGLQEIALNPRARLRPLECCKP